ncbi:MAG: uncharacterized protein A8A55_0751, partial [Amphiamblys sp. WSBS2006]
FLPSALIAVPAAVPACTLIKHCYRSVKGHVVPATGPATIDDGKKRKNGKIWTIPPRLVPLERQLERTFLNYLLNTEEIPPSLFSPENTLDLVLLFGQGALANTVFILRKIHKERTEQTLRDLAREIKESLDGQEAPGECCPVSLFLDVKTLANLARILHEIDPADQSFSYLLSVERLHNAVQKPLCVKEYFASLVGDVFALYGDRGQVGVPFSTTLFSLCQCSSGFLLAVSKDMAKRNIKRLFSRDTLSLMFFSELQKRER